MKYMGSKNRHAKYILPIMLNYRSDDMTWVEPFVGGANMIDKVDGTRIGGDYNRYVIEALTAIRDNLEELPKNNKEFTEKMYHELRQSDDYKYKGYVGFTASYGGKWLGGWSRTDSTAIKQRDYIAESYRNAVKQSPKLKGVTLVHCSYDKLEIPSNSIIYCDPPYANTTAYKTGDFDHKDFWNWCRNMEVEGHTIFVSEYTAPDDFKCVWSKEVNNTLVKDTGSKKGIERLFTLETKS